MGPLGRDVRYVLVPIHPLQRGKSQYQPERLQGSLEVACLPNNEMMTTYLAKVVRKHSAPNPKLTYFVAKTSMQDLQPRSTRNIRRLAEAPSTACGTAKKRKGVIFMSPEGEYGKHDEHRKGYDCISAPIVHHVESIRGTSLAGRDAPMILDPYAQHQWMPLITVAAAEIVDAYSRFNVLLTTPPRPGNSRKSLKWSYSAEKGTLEISRFPEVASTGVMR